VLVKVASYNIHKCRGTDGAFRPDRIIDVIGEIHADLVALQEVDRRFSQKGRLLDPHAILRATGMHVLVQSDGPESLGWHGNALLVRGHPLTYRRSRLRLPGFEARGAIVAELNLGRGEFRVIAAHLGLLRRSRIDQAGAILAAFNDLPPMPTILLGDLNEWRRRRGSALLVFEETFGAGASLLSFPSRRPLLALDRIFGWPAGLVTDVAVHDSALARIASDHLPLTARAHVAAKLPIRPLAA
jgi:endonuclease/exonuclease/phosphatase family metal-dependent hydrolase